MKKYIFLLFALTMMVLSSCITSRTFTVNAKPGTEIFYSQKDGGGKLAEADNTGKAKVSISDEFYCSFLFSKEPGSDLYVPFAIDYQQNNYTLAKFGKYASMVSAFAGAGCFVVGIGGATLEGDPSMAGIGLIGAAFCLGGCIAGKLIDGDYLHQTAQLYSYRYLDHQTTNQDFTFTKPEIEIVAPPRAGNIKTGKKAQEKTENGQSSKSNKKVGGQKSNKTFTDYAAKLEGEYVGTGTLKLGKQTIESYTDIQVILEKVGNNTVSVMVMESNGEEFFASADNYRIEKENGSYKLTHEKISSATITIDANNNLTYTHPKVDIDGDMYTLSIKAKAN